MDKLFETLLTSGNQVTVVGVLMTEFVFLVIGLYREWFVLGKPYKKCMTRVAEFEARATDKAAANEAKVAVLEAKVADLLERLERRHG